MLQLNATWCERRRCWYISLNLNMGDLLIFDKHRCYHPPVKLVQSKEPRVKGGGACYLGNNSESPWGKDVATDLWTSDCLSVNIACHRQNKNIKHIWQALSQFILQYPIHSYRNSHFYLTYVHSNLDMRHDY